MGAFDVLKGNADDLGAPAAGTDEEKAVGGLLGEGGLSSLMKKFDAAGLGDKVKSWVGKGDNLPVSGNDIKSVLGSGQISAVASKLGISSEEATSKIAGLLPTIIDKLTPDGVVPDPDALAGKLTGFLKK